MKTGNKRSLRDILMMTGGTLLLSLSVYFFEIPNGFTTGGVSGLGTLLGKITPLTPPVWIAILNVALLILGFCTLGAATGIWTVYCSLLLSGVTNLLEWVVPLDGPLTDQPFLELVYAMFLTGIGSAMIFYAGATSGGTDITAMILNKYTKLDTGKALLVSDVLVAGLAFFVFGTETGLLSMLSLFVKAFLIDGIIESLDACKYFVIITEKPEEIEQFIIGKLERTATVVRGTGAYSGQEKTMLHTVVKRREAIRLRSGVKSVDPSAFVIITTSTEILGLGFHDL